MNIKIVAVVALGGAVGAVCRFLMMSGVGHIWKHHFPLSTFLVNVLGCFIIGALTEIMMQHEGFTLLWRSFLIVGILGGFTTFSSFSLDAGLLIEKGQWLMASSYIVGSVLLSLLAFFSGIFLFR